MQWDQQIEVNGQPITLDWESFEPAAGLVHWGRVLAEAEADEVRVETEYRAWRASVGEQALKKDPKLSEWKIKQKVESDPNFKGYREAVAVTIRNRILVQALYDACSAQAEI